MAGPVSSQSSSSFVPSALAFSLLLTAACVRKPPLPVETVPLTERLSAYPSLSCHVVATPAQREAADGELDELEGLLVVAAQRAKPGPEVLDRGATGALDLRATVVKLERIPVNDLAGRFTDEAVVHFDLVATERQHVLASFDIETRLTEELVDSRFNQNFHRMKSVVERWLREKKKAR